MPTDNVALNAGNGGATVRSLADAGGLEWPVAVATYATTVSAGANVLQVVTPSAGLPVAQQGAWTVEPGNTPNTSPWLVSVSAGGNTAAVTTGSALKVDGSAVTQPVSGTVTANLGTIAGCALDTSVNGVLVAQAASSTGLKGPMVQGVVGPSSPPTFTAGNVEPLQLDVNGYLLVNTGPAPGLASASMETSTVYDGTTALTPQFAVINASSSGSTTVVAGVAGKVIRVLRFGLNANGTVNATFQTSSTSANISGTRYLQQSVNTGGSPCAVGLFQTLPGDSLNINLSAAVAVSGECTFLQF